jgi:hypothetical protein
VARIYRDSTVLSRALFVFMIVSIIRIPRLITVKISAARVFGFGFLDLPRGLLMIGS